MAKRVFEIARELNLTTKELLVKLKDMDVTVKSHMSTLDEAMEGVIRENLFGKKRDDAIEETRIKPTVIRRRRKLAREASGSDETAVEQDVASTTEVPVETLPPTDTPAPEEVVETVSSSAAPESGGADTEEAAPESPVTELSPEAEPVPPEAKTPEEPPEKHAEKNGEKSREKKRVAEKKREEAARIIKIPVPEAPSEELPAPEAVAEEPPPEVETPAEESQAVEPPAPEEPAAEPPAPEEPVEEAPTVAATEPEKEMTPEPEAPVEKKATEKPVKESTEEAPEKEAAPKPAKPKKAKKKQPKETPAKIIQLPVSPPPQEANSRPGAAGPPARGQRRPNGLRPAVDTTAGPASAKDKKKGKRGRGAAEEPTKDKKFFKKKISFRRREVVEGAALYTSGKRGRKGRKGGKAAKATTGQKPQITVAKAIKRRVKIDDTIVLAELAKRMGIKAADMIRTLMGMGVMATVNQTIDFETAVLVAGEFDYEVERAAFEEDTIIKEETDDPENMVERPPVVTIMGHVDHGKTSLLDVIRKTRITATEAGGITQHIGAYNVSTDRGQIVFLDTPGHEAFTAMRARGAKVTDLVVLVVAADDGVMPQTVEAINHAKASEVPIVVAINKIDKPNAEPDKVQRQLAEIGLAPEEWGGDTIYVHVSAKQNEGINTLLEMILLQSEMLELQANPDRLAAGHVVEAKLDSGRGPVATVLVQKGTLHNGDPVVCGVHHGKIRAMLNDRGQQVAEAGPSIPVEIIGLSGVPLAGDEMVALESEKDAKQVSLHRTQKLRSQELAKNSRMSLEGLFEKMKTGEVKDLNLIIKADVDGSIEALRDSLVKLSNEEVKINVVHAATGTITESDVSLAAVSNAIIIGFNVRPNTKVADMALEENVDVRLHNVIYDVIQEVKSAIVGMMASTYEERILGKAEVREVFHVPKVGAIAGSHVTDGKIERGQQARLLREGVIRYDGKISSLRRFKDDVKEVQSGYECGIGIANFNDIKIGDVIECYFMEEIKPELD